MPNAVFVPTAATCAAMGARGPGSGYELLQAGAAEMVGGGERARMWVSGGIGGGGGGGGGGGRGAERKTTPQNTSHP
jgi:hypothetical protein